MTKTDSLINDLLKATDDSINSFNAAVPDIQKQLFGKLQNLLKDLETKNGKLSNTVANIKAIGSLKTEIEKAILSKDYIANVTDFAKSFEIVSTLSDNYFAAITSDYSPNKVLNAIRKDAVGATVISLTESGISANVTEGIQNILRTSITTGGNYADLMEQMRTFILSDGKGLGALERYTKQITTDSLNQYSATYNHTVTNDLGLEWFMYTGSNLETTRPFCKLLTEKKYIHKSEIPTILNGHIDNHNVPINPKTDVWAGGIPRTNESNFSINRGGYNCGHQLIPVTDAMVPDSAKSKSINHGNPPVNPTIKPTAAFIDHDFEKQFPVNINPSAYSLFNKKADIKFIKSAKSSHYDPSNDKIVINKNRRFDDSEWYRESVLYHEMGHKAHFNQDIITHTKIAPEFSSIIGKCKLAIKGNEANIEKSLRVKLFAGNEDQKNQAAVIFDILGALTKGKYGGGHSKKYYKTTNMAAMEVFAHGNSNYFKSNPMFDDIPEIKKVLEDYFNNLYSNR